MRAGRLDFDVEQGARWYPNVIIWRDGDGNAVDITNYAAKIQIRTNKDDNTIIETLSSAFGDLILGGANGTVQIDMSAERTKDLTFNRAVYDLLLFPYVGSVINNTDYTSCNINVDQGSSRGQIIGQGTPWSGLSIDDYIELDNCEDSDTDGVYKIYTVDNTEIVLYSILGGGNNADDTSLTVQELNNDQIVRLAEGYLYLSKRITQ